MPQNIVITSGGSAGHIYPALTLYDELVNSYGRDINIIFITSKDRLSQEILRRFSGQFYALPAGIKNEGLSLVGDIARFYPFKTVILIMNLIRGYFRSIKIIRRKKVSCCVAFGSVNAVAPFMAAATLKIPTIIHEQNIVLGRANKIMSLFATKVALSFAETTGLGRRPSAVTGNPIRSAASKRIGREEALECLGLNKEKTTILVMGGSQGSVAVNSAVIKLIAQAERSFLSRIQLIHIAGQRDIERIGAFYKTSSITSKVLSFFEEMYIIYSATDIAISRAGSSAIFELSHHAIASILIPYPYADAHQVKNAQFIASNGGCLLLEERGMADGLLHSKLSELVKNVSYRHELGKRMAEISGGNSSERLAQEVIKILRSDGTRAQIS
ncbi:MAG: UDP-N-acetylglucosamine--N-acetylmuramyl-(pentapeptide) pyrophosphoryl-undecaprenol N-acetylglucosamine transferase [Candidatus Omnitrophica bacterium]|nr:UDP-N-acetylglucosamine--N-acetylmuramyl-(pentapeptide) pyrophosphoryl-undecaprenol N-acetylglucosamine transferase [Candidatus Omnitrophota bacterium]